MLLKLPFNVEVPSCADCEALPDLLRNRNPYGRPRHPARKILKDFGSPWMGRRDAVPMVPRCSGCCNRIFINPDVIP